MCIIAFSSHTSVAGPELKMALGELRQPDLARVGDDEGGTVRTAFLIRSASTGCASVVFDR